MVELIYLQTISTIIAGLTVSVAAFYYIMNLRSQRVSRKMMLYLPVYQRFQEKDFGNYYLDITWNWEWKDYEDFTEKYSTFTNLEAFSQWNAVMNYFHCVGSLLKRNELDINLISDLMQTMSVKLWEKVEPIVNSIRVSVDYPRYLHGFEYLYDTMKKREQLEQKT